MERSLAQEATAFGGVATRYYYRRYRDTRSMLYLATRLISSRGSSCGSQTEVERIQKSWKISVVGIATKGGPQASVKNVLKLASRCLSRYGRDTIDRILS